MEELLGYRVDRYAVWHVQQKKLADTEKGINYPGGLSIVVIRHRVTRQWENCKSIVISILVVEYAALI